jgi:N,N'-diacetyllegionaminate synthase
MEENMVVRINGSDIGKGSPAYIIAEVAQAHDGSLGAAHSFVDIAKEAGANAIKFQTHFADEETTLDDIFRVNFSYQDATRYDYWKRMEFSEDQWRELFQHCQEVGIEPISTPFSVKAIDLLKSLDVAAWKVASGEVLNAQFYQAMADHNVPVLLSSGMSGFEETKEAIKLIECCGFSKYAIFQCTTSYPTPLNSVGLNNMEKFRSEFGVPVGLSDHSGEYLTSVAAISQGANIIEVHLALDRKQFGPDTSSSLMPHELKEVCRARDVLFELSVNQTNKDELVHKMAEVKTLFGRSLALRRSVTKGESLTEENLCFKKPGLGITPKQAKNYIGRRFARDVCFKHLLREEDFESE